MALNENAQQWVNALRSGEYQQAKGKLAVIEAPDTLPSGIVFKGLTTGKVLYDEEIKPLAFCCLGVACDIFIKSGGDLEISVGSDNEAEPLDWGLTYDDELSVLPEIVRDWLGLVGSSGEYLRDTTAGVLEFTLTAQNDGGADFSTIADIIEEEPEGLFIR